MSEATPNTKLILLYSSNPYEAELHQARIANFMVLYGKLGYQFPLTPLPVVSVKAEEVTREYLNIFKRKKTYTQREACYYLEFPRPLTDDETNAWRMFKLGYLCAICRPVGLQ